ncbi:MAG TPA: dockerin type I domain-containing protein [Thermoanaerobaculia bacterium]|nr:dockerin type I domain-containing protein [Thermoanaerobaculia bacterium]
MSRFPGVSGLFRVGSLAALFLGTPLRAADSPYGINAHAPQGADLAALFDAAKAARIGWVRIDFAWSAVERSPGDFDFSVYDALVSAAAARGLSVYATLGSTPGWATDGPALTGVPRSPADFAAFCARASARYGTGVAVWGFWNEPNLAVFWSGTRQQYIDAILKPGADAIHAASPGARVAGPELANLVSNGAVWYRWLTDVIAQAGDRLDVVSHHVYGSSAAAVTAKLETPTVFGANPAYWDYISPSVKEVLEASGWLGKPFWLTETGWASDQIGEDAQAAQITGLLNDWATSQAGRAWLSHVFFYELVDDGTAGIPKWGILRSDRTAKPAEAAYRSFIVVHTKGDVNGDGAIDVSDVFALVNFLYSGGPPPVGIADLNADGNVNVADVFYLASFLFAGGPPPK